MAAAERLKTKPLDAASYGDQVRLSRDEMAADDRDYPPPSLRGIPLRSPLGDPAYVRSAVYLLCRRTFQVSKVGLIRLHGPTNNRCSGSGNPLAGRISFPTSSSAIPGPSAIPNPTDVTSEAMPLDSISFMSTPKILKRISCASQYLAATRLATILDGISTRNDMDAWVRLFKFPSRCLRAPKRGGNRQSLASEVNQLLRDEADPTPSQPPSHRHPKYRRDPLNTLAIRVATKLEGDYRGAVHLAYSEDSFCQSR